MLNRIKTLASLFLELGPRWSAFRLAYAFRLRTGLIRLQMPQYKWTDRPLEHWLKPTVPSDSVSYAAWRKQNTPKFFQYRKIHFASRKVNLAVLEADRLLNGELKYFSHEYRKTGFPPIWNDGGQKHWSQISDDHVIARRALALPDEASPWRRGDTIPNGEEVASAKNASQRHVDIKFIWEPNRFAFVYTLVRAYAATGDEKYPQAFWQLIQDWADHNPPNTGPNWMDGQEIALRLMAWTFGFYSFIHSPSTTNLQISQFTNYLASQTERIHKNIGYAISTRSNHTISEAFGLWMVGLLFPELKEAEKYFKLGKRLLEEEAAKQIFPDGSYAMYSLNYHRFILHLYLYAIRLAEQNNFKFSNSLYSSITSSIRYLSHLIDPTTGGMPVYGSNDGALVLPLNNCDFTDYRPLLQLGSVITTGERMFEEGEWDEDVYWLCGNSPLSQRERARVRENSPSSFPQGGIYVIRNTNSRAIIRCTDFTSRPSHADQLHMDLWMGSHNIAIDAGTYLYSGEGIWRNGLARTSAHNTVTVDGKDQMTLVSRFTWTNWSKGRVLKQTENLWQGEHDGYKPIRHKRTVMALEGDRWLVLDDLAADEPHHYSLHWLLADYGIQKLASGFGVLLRTSDSLLSDSIKIQSGVFNGEGKFTILRADPGSIRGWRSRYYAHKEPAISLLLEANQPAANFWTFFGFERDVVEVNGNVLKINRTETSLKTMDF
ncbi:MAG: alginate lyase family protein [Chloroflexi bacterium]|nr:alginate lyase family protein [Chloroflexota bacterium]